jgi:hypothetical protein
VYKSFFSFLFFLGEKSRHGWLVVLVQAVNKVVLM